MEKQKNNDELFQSLLELNIRYAIENSNINIKMIDNRIKFYETLISHLENDKPLFFQKKKLIEYENKKSKYKNKIAELYNQLNKEYEIIEKLYFDI